MHNRTEENCHTKPKDRTNSDYQFNFSTFITAFLRPTVNLSVSHGGQNITRERRTVAAGSASLPSWDLPCLFRNALTEVLPQTVCPVPACVLLLQTVPEKRLVISQVSDIFFTIVELLLKLYITIFLY